MSTCSVYLDSKSCTTAGVLVATGKENRSFSRDFSFLRGLAYAELVRLADGTVWKVAEDELLVEIRKFHKDFEAEHLKDRDWGAIR